MKVPVRLYGDPVLRKHCEPVKEITPEIKQLIADLIDTAEEHWGMAAPQLGFPVRIFVCRFPIFGEDGKRTGDTDLRVWINPKLSDPSQEIWSHGEACVRSQDYILALTGPMQSQLKPWMNKEIW